MCIYKKEMKRIPLKDKYNNSEDRDFYKRISVLFCFPQTLYEIKYSQTTLSLKL